MYLGSSVATWRSSSVEFYMYAGVFFFCAQTVVVVVMFQNFRK